MTSIECWQHAHRALQRLEQSSSLSALSRYEIAQVLAWAGHQSWPDVRGHLKFESRPAAEAAAHVLIDLAWDGTVQLGVVEAVDEQTSRAGEASGTLWRVNLALELRQPDLQGLYRFRRQVFALPGLLHAQLEFVRERLLLEAYLRDQLN